VIWVGLVLATCLTWWLVTGYSAANRSLRVTVAVAIIVPFLKVYFIGSEFMELRTAPPAPRALFSA